MSCSNCCFLTCLQVSQEAGQVIWYSHLFQNFPQFIVIHTVKGFGIVNKVETDVFLELSIMLRDLPSLWISCADELICADDVICADKLIFFESFICGNSMRQIWEYSLFP